MVEQNLYEELKELLETEDKFYSEGRVLKNKVMESALKQDEDLLELLLNHDRLKEHFFTTVDGGWVFDKQKFLDFVNNKQFLPNSYTKFKNKIGLKTDDEYFTEKNDVTLVWAYKDCILEGGQTEEDSEKRKEIFWNETLAPDEIDRLLGCKVLSNFKEVNEDGESEPSQVTQDDNLLIKGNNLLALHSLLSKYRNEVRLIYIDPPYNTGNDNFKYNDNFNHSTWLTFMKNRLETAKEFLTEDGTIYIQIDIREQPYLKVLCDDIFGDENFLGMVNLKSKASGGVGQGSYIFDICEYILIYCVNKDKVKNHLPKVEGELKNKVKRVYNQVMVDMGEEEHLKTIEGGNVGEIDVYKHKEYETTSLYKDERTKENYFENFENIYRTTNPQGGLMKRVMPKIPSEGLVSIEYEPTKGRREGEKYRYYFIDGSLIVWLKDSAVKDTENREVKKLVKNNNLWTENLHQGIANEGGVELKNGKKPEALIRKILRMATEEGDLVLDYHLGSGTTAAVAHKMNRKYIGIEQIDYGENSPYQRLKNVIEGDKTGISKQVDWQGGGSFICCELMKLNQHFIELIESAENTEELIDIWGDMKEEAFLSYRLDVSEFEDEAEEFSDLSFENQKKFLLEMLDKNQLYVNYSEIDNEDYDIDEDVKELNKQFYGDN